jgi:O-antigen/teichoic acid export membrane protein
VTIRRSYFIRSLGAGYFSIAVNIIYTAASVPLALHYLGKDQFGLWSLAQQIVGYLMLLDLGVTAAVSRFIADRKDDVDGGDYGRLLLTGVIVFALQGVLIAVVGLAFSILAPFLFAVPAPLAGEFRNVLILITSLAGLSVFTRSLGAPLWAFQRMDFSYFMGSLTLVLGFASLWLGFCLGWGIYSFAVSGLPAALLCPVITFFFCKKNGFYPSTQKGWQLPSWPDIRKVFVFGKDAALMSLGSQMVNASQIMIISRFVGLDAAATFSVGTKLYSLGQQLVAKVIGTAAPALTELFVRGEASKFKARFFDVVSITIFLATLFATVLVSGNSAVVSIWTSGMMSWTRYADALLGSLLVTTCVSRCLTELFVFRGNLKSVRYIFLLEGMVSVSLALTVAAKFGSFGILFMALLAHLSVTFCFSLRAVAEAFSQANSVSWWILKSFLILSAVFIISHALSQQHITMTCQLLFMLLLVVLSSGLSWYLLLSRPLRAEVVERFISFKVRHSPSSQ